MSVVDGMSAEGTQHTCHGLRRMIAWAWSWLAPFQTVKLSAPVIGMVNAPRALACFVAKISGIESFRLRVLV